LLLPGATIRLPRAVVGEFLAINPGGRAGAETDDGLTAESVHLPVPGSAAPEPPLFGSSPRQEALTLMWANIVENDGLLAVAEVLRNLSPGFRDHVLPGPQPYPQIPALVARGRQRTEQFFDRVEQQLLHRQFLAGGDFSFADISLLVTADFAGWVDINPMGGRPALDRWYGQVAARPGAQA
jgi:glutathione S-transferase